MFYTIYAFINNLIYLIKTPRPISYKFLIFYHYFLYSFLLLLPLVPKPSSIRIFKYRLYGFDFKALQYLYGEIFVKNEYFFKADKDKPLILDCGSNIGASVIYFKHLYPSSTIFAFEPDPETFKLLKNNVKINKLKDVHLYNIALNDKKGRNPFYIGEKAGNLMMSSLRGRISKRVIKVDSERLSGFVRGKKIDFMKMDIEGDEVKVVKEMQKARLLGNIKEAIIEYHHNIIGHEESLGNLLTLFEKVGFKYKIDTQSIPIYSKGKFQDILVVLYK